MLIHSNTYCIYSLRVIYVFNVVVSKNKNVELSLPGSFQTDHI